MAVKGGESFDGARPTGRETGGKSFPTGSSEGTPPPITKIVSPHKAPEGVPPVSIRKIISPMTMGDKPHEIHASVPPEQVPPTPPTDRAAIDPVEGSDVYVRPRQPEGERLLPDEPHSPDEPSEEPSEGSEIDPLRNLLIYTQATSLARNVHDTLYVRGEGGELNIGDENNVRRVSVRRTLTKEEQRITKISTETLITEGDLDRLTLRRNDVEEVAGGQLDRQTAYVMDSDGKVVRFRNITARPTSNIPPESDEPRHAKPEVDVPDQRDPVSDSFPAIPAKERLATHLLFEEKVARGDPEEGDVGLAVSRELVDILEDWNQSLNPDRDQPQ